MIQEKRKQLSTEYWLVAGSLGEMDSFSHEELKIKYPNPRGYISSFEASSLRHFSQRAPLIALQN